MKWYECEGCGSEFRVVSDSDQIIEYCPFCSHPIEEDDSDMEDDEEDY